MSSKFKCTSLLILAGDWNLDLKGNSKFTVYICPPEILKG
jgi:hypothetical protein